MLTVEEIKIVLGTSVAGICSLSASVNENWKLRLYYLAIIQTLDNHQHPCWMCPLQKAGCKIFWSLPFWSWGSVLSHSNMNSNGMSAFLLFKWPVTTFVLASKDGPGWKSTWEKVVTVTSVSTHLCRWGVLPVHFQPSVSNVICTVRVCSAWHDTWIKKGWGSFLQEEED